MEIRAILMLALMASIAVQASSTQDIFILIKARGPTPIQDLDLSSQGIIVAAGPRGEASARASYIGLYHEDGFTWLASFQGNVKCIASGEDLAVAGLSMEGGEAAVLIADTRNMSAIIAGFEEMGEPLRGSIRGAAIVRGKIIVAGSVGIGGGPYPRTGLLAVLDGAGHVERAYRLYGLDPTALALCGSRALLVGETLGGGIIVAETDGTNTYNPRMLMLPGNVSLTVSGAHSNGVLAAVTAESVTPGGRVEPVVIAIDCTTHKAIAYELTLPQGVAGLAGKPYVSRSGVILVPINIIIPGALKAESILLEVMPSSGEGKPLLAITSADAGVYISRAIVQSGTLIAAGGLILPSKEQAFIEIVGIPLEGGKQWATAENITIEITGAPQISLEANRISLAQSSQAQLIVQDTTLTTRAIPVKAETPIVVAASLVGTPGESTFSSPATSISQSRTTNRSAPTTPTPAPSKEPGSHMVYVLLVGILLLFAGTALLLLPLAFRRKT